MARLTAGDASLDQLPWAYRKGHGKEIGWKAGARCRTMNQTVTSPRFGGEPSIWQVEDDKTYVNRRGEVVSGADLIDVAVKHCLLCSVQWECAAYAVSCEERFGVWAMTIDELTFLRRQIRNPQDFIVDARAHAVPIQVAVRARMK